MTYNMAVDQEQALERLLGRCQQLEQLLRTCRGVLDTLARADLKSWVADHEPLRTAAQNLVPEIDALLGPNEWDEVFRA